jgi:hypothetical protein
LGSLTHSPGIAWNAGREGRHLIRDSPWEASVKAAGLSIFWDDGNCNVYAVKPLLEVVASGDALTDQARATALWAEETIRTALALPEPPDADHQL